MATALVIAKGLKLKASVLKPLFTHEMKNVSVAFSGGIFVLPQCCLVAIMVVSFSDSAWEVIHYGHTVLLVTVMRNGIFLKCTSVDFTKLFLILGLILGLGKS